MCGKCLSISFKNSRAISVFTFLLKGGLYHITFRCRLLRVLVLVFGCSWSKRNSDNTFDVTMGSYEGAEVCELIGLFILNTLQDRFGKDVGLYRDDGLAVINTRSGRLCDRERKELAAVFDNLRLKITAQTNQLRTNFLDLVFDLNNGS